jgi:pentapeptide repeat protein
VISLGGADLRGLVIEGNFGDITGPVNLSRADLRRAVFRGAKAFVNLTSSDVRNADFSGADLSAVLHGACLSGARFVEARVDGGGYPDSVVRALPDSIARHLPEPYFAGPKAAASTSPAPSWISSTFGAPA